MNDSLHKLDTLTDIRRMMEKSSRFISLRGWSGVAAGTCAFVGAGIANGMIDAYRTRGIVEVPIFHGRSVLQTRFSALEEKLIVLALTVLLAAVISAFFFTYLRSKKEDVPLWGPSARRLMWNTLFPLAVGGVVIFHLLMLGQQGLVAPLCLIFYGLALINGSKFTLGEVKYLGYCEVLLGLINLWLPGYGLICWTIGFGLLHIIYGIWMWAKYERA